MVLFESFDVEKSCLHCIRPRETEAGSWGISPKCISLGEGFLGREGLLEHKHPSGTPSSENKEVAVNRRPGPEVGIVSLKDSSKPTCRSPRAEGLLCAQV